MGAAQDAEHDACGVFTGFVFDGDRVAAARQIPLAQNLLHKLRAFVKKSGTQVYSMSVNFEGGHIQASINSGIEQVYIFASSNYKQSQDFVEEPDIFSGVVKGGDIVTIVPPIVGAQPFETLRNYKPTLQAYNYPLKKKPGNYPNTVTLPGNTFEDQPRLVVPAYAPVLSLPGYNTSIGDPWLFSGNMASALEQVTAVQNVISNMMAALVLQGNIGFFRKTIASSVGYASIYCEVNEKHETIASVYIFGEGEPTVIGSRKLYTEQYQHDLTAVSVVFENYAQIYKPLDISPISQYRELNASRYSGLMSKAVQVILGYGKLKSKNASEINQLTGVQVKYDWRWARCHGIVTAADGALWLVEISIVNGVIAMPFPLFSNTVKGTPVYSQLLKSTQDVLKKSVELFGGLPSGGTFPTGLVPAVSPPGTLSLLQQAIVKGEVLLLATPASMASFYEKNEYSTWLGWTFNANTKTTHSEAHNTCYSLLDNYSGANYLATGHHFKINISIGARVKNRAPNQPIAEGSAVLSEVSNAKLVANMNFYDEIAPYKPSIQSPASTYDSIDAYLPRATILACHIDNILHKVWTERHTGGSFVNIPNNVSINEFLQAESVDGAGGIYPRDYGTYNLASTFISKYASFVKSDKCEITDGEVQRTTVIGSMDVTGPPGPPNMVAGIGWVTSVVENRILRHYHTDVVTLWSGFTRDGYVASRPYIENFEVNSSKGTTSTGPVFTLLDTVDKTYSRQLNYRIISAYTPEYQCADVDYTYSGYPSTTYLTRTISKVKAGVFGSATSNHFVFDDYAKDSLNNRYIGGVGSSGPKNPIYDKTSCVGSLLAAESNNTRVNYSFLGYI